MSVSVDGQGLSIQFLEFEFTVLSPLGLGRQVGSALRGAIFESMRYNLNVCLYKNLPSCQTCTLRQTCPLSGLLATVDDDAPRGHDAPRPMAIRPPIDGRRNFPVDSKIGFSVALFGDGSRYLPYLVLAARELARTGLGMRFGGPHRVPPERGQVKLDSVHAVNPLTGHRDVILAPNSDLLRPSQLTVTSGDVVAWSRTLSPDLLTLELLTPMRLIEGGQLVRPLRFDVLVHRLLDRIESLAQHYGPGASLADVSELREQARKIQIERDSTRWIDLETHSSRTHRWSPTGGFVGRITFSGELAPFLPLLTWGMLIHVGKSATRGNGLYRILRAEEKAS